MWRLGSSTDWADIARLSSGWANAHEISLAREFVDRLDSLPDSETGTILFELEGADDAGKALAADLAKEFKAMTFLGLQAKLGIPDRPEGPAVACRVRLDRHRGHRPGRQQRRRRRRSGSPSASSPCRWPRMPPRTGPRSSATRWPRACWAGWSGRSSDAGPQVKGKATYQVRIENASPLILNGLAVLGTGDAEGEAPKELSASASPPAGA